MSQTNMLRLISVGSFTIITIFSWLVTYELERPRCCNSSTELNIIYVPDLNDGIENNVYETEGWVRPETAAETIGNVTTPF